MMLELSSTRLVVTAMRAILVPVETHPHLRSALQSALLLSQTFGSYIEGFALIVLTKSALRRF
jgi:hypothetical protein